MAFTNEQLERYSRHIILKEVGVKGQKKLLGAKVLIIGAGGLGAPAAMYLAAAGVGTIGIVDANVVDLSNLQRQIIHATDDVGKEIFEAGEQINIRTLTYKQLDWLLNQPGDYLILLGGSWCGNTRAVIDIINDYAVANDVTVYNFDTKLDGGYAKKFWGYEGDVHIRDSENVFAKLYVDLVNKYFENIETEYTIDSGKYIYYLSDPADESTQVIANKLQVPYFLAYNKDAVNNDGHSTPILGYFEKMYVLDESKEDYIGIEENYKDYTAGTFAVINAYAAQTGITAVDIVTEDSEPAEAEVAAVNAKAVQADVAADNQAETAPVADSPTDEPEKADNGTLTKVIVAVVGAAAIAGVVVFAVLKKKNSSGGGSCC